MSKTDSRDPRVRDYGRSPAAWAPTQASHAWRASWSPRDNASPSALPGKASNSAWWRLIGRAGLTTGAPGRRLVGAARAVS